MINDFKAPPTATHQPTDWASLYTRQVHAKESSRHKTKKITLWSGTRIGSDDTTGGAYTLPFTPHQDI